MLLAHQISTWIKTQAQKQNAICATVLFPNLNAHSLALAHLWKQTGLPLHCFSFNNLTYPELNIKNIIVKSTISNNLQTELSNQSVAYLCLKQFCQEKRAVLLSPSDYLDYHLLRNLDNYQDYDLFPLSSLLTEEVEALSKHLTGIDMPAILSASTEERWVSRQQRLTGFLNSSVDPAKSEEYWKFTLPQQIAISKIYHRKQMTDHILTIKPVYNQ